MKLAIFTWIVFVITGCHTSRSSGTGQDIGKTASLSWSENKKRAVATIAPGIPAIQQTAVDYKRNGKISFKIILNEPHVIVVADKPQPWGYYQFPTISRLKDGSLHADWSMHADAIESYGLHLVGSSISNDGGKTWKRGLPDSSLLTGYTLPNGDMIRVFDPKPVKVSELNMPEPVGKTNFRYRKTNFTFYRLKDMPEGRNGVYIKRLAKGESHWKLEQASLEDPQAVRYSSRDLVPVVWWGDIHTMSDHSLVAGIYPGYYIKDNGEVDKQMGVVFYRSTDNGRSWKLQGRIPFTPDVKN